MSASDDVQVDLFREVTMVAPSQTEERKGRRPLGVWIISAFYLIAAGWTLLSSALIYTGAIPLNEAQRQYFASLSVVDLVLATAVGLLGIVAALALFLLRRVAVMLFTIALVVNISVSVIRTNWVAAASATPGTMPGLVLGWVVLIAVLLYARKLEKKGILV